MALAYPHILFLFELRKHDILPQTVRLMEFGQQNWYGDVPLSAIVEAANTFNARPIAEMFQKQFEMLTAEQNSGDPVRHSAASFNAAELYYRTLFELECFDAVDLHGNSRAIKQDLNEPLSISKKYNMVINFGTGEHVFNQYSFFKNMHDVCETGGVMLHSLPNQGCYDHGFYNYHPTFLFDLALANQYEVVTLILADLSKKPPVMTTINRESYVKLAVEKTLSAYSGLLTCFIKKNDADFVVPQQGYYSNQLPKDLEIAWTQMDR